MVACLNLQNGQTEDERQTGIKAGLEKIHNLSNNAVDLTTIEKSLWNIFSPLTSNILETKTLLKLTEDRLINKDSSMIEFSEDDIVNILRIVQNKIETMDELVTDIDLLRMKLCKS